MAVSSIQVCCGAKTCAVEISGSETLLSALRRAGFSLPAACGGRGRCGKCRVTVNGVPRLACKVIPAGGDRVVLPDSAGGRILTESAAPTGAVPAGGTGCAAAIDLGTTTIALRLYDLSSGRVLQTASAWNRQASVGADVISRIRHTMDSPQGLHELHRCVRQQTEDMVSGCLERAGRKKTELRRVSLAGNTVMQHIFAGLPVGSIAAAPYTPASLFRRDTEDTLLGAPIYYAPCVAGYVGGDITAGLLAAGLPEKDGQWLFLDIGTNGEMALGGRDGFACCAVASGPAFEGANIRCGMPALDGAVSRVRYDRGFLWDVIGGGEAKGLCGSGLIDLVAALLRLGCIDGGGRLLPPEDAPPACRKYIAPDGKGNGIFHLTRGVYLTAGDVRALQLAKAAVAAGIRVLLEERNIGVEALSGVCIAGGFGNYIDPRSAMAIGMLPRLPEEKLLCLGNTALAGASMAALDEKNRRALADIAAGCRYRELSGCPAFTRAFTENLVFDETEDTVC